MKHFFYTTLILLLCPVFVSAQTKQINEIFDRYENMKDVVSINVSSSLIRSVIKSSSDKNTQDLVSKIDGIRILNIDSDATNNNGIPLARSLKAEIDRLVSSSRMESVLKIKDGEDNLELFVSNNSKDALLFINSNPDELAVIAFFGTIDKSLIDATISGKINIKQ